MAHLERFELPTDRFVADYSIQLSYRCVLFIRLRADIISAKNHLTTIFYKLAQFFNFQLNNSKLRMVKSTFKPGAEPLSHPQYLNFYSRGQFI